MAYMIRDFECVECGHVFEEMYDTDEEDLIRCAQCNSPILVRCLSTPNIAAFSLLDENGRKESLLKRSAKHTQKLVDQEPEKFKGNAGIDRRTKKVQVGYGD